MYDEENGDPYTHPFYYSHKWLWKMMMHYSQRPRRMAPDKRLKVNEEDSKLITNQFGGIYRAKDERTSAYLDVIHSLARRLRSVSITKKSRHDVRHADALAYLSAATNCKEARTIQVEYQEQPSIDFTTLNHRKIYVDECLALQVLYSAQASYAVRSKKRIRGEVEITGDDINSEMNSPDHDETLDSDQQQSLIDVEHIPSINDWRVPYIEYLQHQTLPEDKKLADYILRTSFKVSKKVMTRTLNSARTFQPGDWVLRRKLDDPSGGKLSKAWEGPFIVEKTGPKGYYVLKTLSRDFLPKPWNATRLRKFYH
ncbi:hypothetical protein IFM89_034109 [Coptis chinensis]|uniref:Uncharacterized protein n=1 Tax=Coptis chinensis TaxID=261450 RepID=A0A835I984_9MAGN|nr:hypothetical protein IFM89_034109 [Coptis chinensis]